jgi:SAM-dependent methyltransferase
MEEKTIEQHYDHLIDIRNDWMYDPPDVQPYMDRTDGEIFFQALGDVRGLAILEIGIGAGRLAHRVLAKNCRAFAGIDASSHALIRCRENLAAFPNVELIHADIRSWSRPDAFDIAYSSLVLFHLPDKRRAIQNIVNSIKRQGRIVLSVVNDDRHRLEFGTYFVRLYPETVAEYEKYFMESGAQIEQKIPVIDTWEFRGKRSDTYGQVIAMVVVARRL